MFVLQWIQGERTQYIGIFETLEAGRNFMHKVPSYHLEIEKFEDLEYENEYILYRELPDIKIIEYNDYHIPISRFSFEEDIMVNWVELDQLDKKHFAHNPNQRKFSTGATRIDAYCINNEEVEDYVQKREFKIQECIKLLENLGFEADRAFFGSEDGEAILYRNGTNGEKEGDWHFLTHLDPCFVDMDIAEEIPKILEEDGHYHCPKGRNNEKEI